MLRIPAEFPHVGSTCFITPHGEEAKILQRNANGSVLVAINRAPTRRIDLGQRLRSDAQQSTTGSASDTRTIQPGDFHATVEAALGKKPAPRGRPTAKRRKAA